MYTVSMRTKNCRSYNNQNWISGNPSLSPYANARASYIMGADISAMLDCMKQ